MRGTACSQQPPAAACPLSCRRGYIRGLGLSVNQALHIPGAGDFLLSQISGPAEPAAANEDATAAAARQRAQGAGGGMDMEGQGAGEPAVLATADPEAQESLVRENVPDPLAGEQTWPTQEVGGAGRLPTAMDSSVNLHSRLCSWGHRLSCACAPWAASLHLCPVEESLIDVLLQELMEAEAARSHAKAVRKRRLPKGTSDYQAAWILDDDDGR